MLEDVTFDQILETQDLEIKAVEVPEWKGTVYLRELPADEGLALNDQMQALPNEKAFEAIFLLLGACLVNAKGERLCTTPEQAAKLRSRNQKVLLRLQNAALKLQGWSPEATPEKNA